MENDIKTWLIFADKVEGELRVIDRQTLAESYLSRISALVSQLRDEANRMTDPSIIRNARDIF